MKKLILFLLLITAIHQTLPAQDRARWRQVFPKNVPPARSSFGMAKLTEGKVLIFGGTDSLGNLLNDTWIFDFKTMDWTQIYPINSPEIRKGHKLSQIKDGKILLHAGKNQNNGWYNDTWLFDIEKKEWQRKDPNGNCLDKYNFGMCKLADGYVIEFGGETNPQTCISNYRIYILSSDYWLDNNYYGPELLRAKNEIAFLNENNVIMYGGGCQNNITKKTQIFNFNSSTWLDINLNNQKPRSSFSFSEISINKLLVFGGTTAENDTTTLKSFWNDDTWILDYNNTIWKELKFIIKPENRYSHSSANIHNNNILLFGGINKNDKVLNDTWIFDYDSIEVDEVMEIPNQKSTYLYPNPANEYINIKLDESNIANADKIEIFDALGENIYYQDITNSQNDMKIDVSSFTRGIYFMKIGKQYKKFVKN